MTAIRKNRPDTYFEKVSKAIALNVYGEELSDTVMQRHVHPLAEEIIEAQFSSFSAQGKTVVPKDFLVVVEEAKVLLQEICRSSNTVTDELPADWTFDHFDAAKWSYMNPGERRLYAALINFSKNYQKE